jgi:hypothetical protein
MTNVRKDHDILFISWPVMYMHAEGKALWENVSFASDHVRELNLELPAVSIHKKQR